jgi:hypothetical protein
MSDKEDLETNTNTRRYTMGLFSKETCTFCGKEAGAMSRIKLRSKEYMCKDCEALCSKYIEPSRLTRDEILAHMEDMRKKVILYNNVFEPYPNKDATIGRGKEGGVIFCDDLGMFQVKDNVTHKNRNLPELFRYDQVSNYSYFLDKTGSSGGDRVDMGVSISLRTVDRFNSTNNSLHPAKSISADEIKLVLYKSLADKEIRSRQNVPQSIIGKFDVIFGKHDTSKAMFQSFSKSDMRNIQAGTEILKSGLAMFKAQKAQNSGEEINQTAYDAQMQTTGNAMNDALTGGLAQYTRNADEAERRAWGA